MQGAVGVANVAPLAGKTMAGPRKTMGPNKLDTVPSGAVKVCLRVRPWIKEETEGSRNDGLPLESCVNMDTKTSCTIMQKKGHRESVGLEDKKTTFEFDRCYWSFDKDHPLYADQSTIYEELGKAQLENAIAGYNNCLFAYGQTGSGKSFSVLGAPDGEDAGLLPRIVRGLFEHFEELDDVSFKCTVSFIEIYQEMIADLLIDKETLKKRAQTTLDPTKLAVREHPVHGTYIPGLVEVAVSTRKEVMQLLSYGMAVRHVAETAMNSSSSRSHCIFTMKTSVHAKGDPISKISQSHVVDLAGSERASRTKAGGARLKEGASINQSLSTLAHVISELTKKHGKPPFRQSKLTHILKESLSGNSKTVMMAAISPSSRDYSETLSTLKFAQSVKQVQTQAKVNQVSEASMEDQLRREVEMLQKKLQDVEDEKHSDRRHIEQLRQEILEVQDLKKRTSVFLDSNWEESLKHDERLRARPARVGIEASDLKFLQGLNETLQANKKVQRERTRSDKSRLPRSEDEPGSSCSTSSVSSAEDEPVPDIIHIKLQDVTLDELRTNLNILQGESREVANAVNGHLEADKPQVRLTPMLALTLAGGTSNLVVKSERVAVPDDQREDPSPRPASEWISEAEFRARHARMKALAEEHGEGFDEEDDAGGKSPGRQSYVKAKLAAITAFAGRPEGASEMAVELRESHALVADLRAQLREARQKISDLSDLQMGHQEGQLGTLARSGTAPFNRMNSDGSSAAPFPRSPELMPRASMESIERSWKLELEPAMRSSVLGFGPREAVLAVEADAPGAVSSSSRFFTRTMSAEEGGAGEADDAGEEEAWQDQGAVAFSADGTRDARQDGAAIAGEKKWAEAKEKKPATPTEGYTWNTGSPKKPGVDVRAGAGTKKTRDKENGSSPGSPASAKAETKSKRQPGQLSFESFRRKKEPMYRSPAYHWVKSLSKADPQDTNYEDALVGKSPAITLFEAMKDRKIAETVKEVILTWPTVTGVGGTESVDAALEILWKGGFLGDSMSRRRSHSTPAPPCRRRQTTTRIHPARPCSGSRAGSIPATNSRNRASLLGSTRKGPSLPAAVTQFSRPAFRPMKNV